VKVYVNMDYQIIPIIFLLLIAVPPILLILIDKIWKTHYSCRWYGWHNGKSGSISFDGCSVHAICSKCGKEVMQDSQGNWF